MQQRDIIKDQIEQLGKVLGKILARLLSMDTPGIEREELEIADQSWEKSFGTDLTKLVRMEPEKFKSTLAKSGFTEPHWEKISDILRHRATMRREEDPELSRHFLLKALLLLDWTDESSATFSFAREQKRAGILQLLSDSGTSH